MGRVKSQLATFGYWPDSSAPASHPPELTIAAKRLAEAALEELRRLGVTVELDNSGRAHFRSSRIPPSSAKRAIEIHGDLIETLLRAKQEAGG